MGYATLRENDGRPVDSHYHLSADYPEEAKYDQARPWNYRSKKNLL